MVLILIFNSQPLMSRAKHPVKVHVWEKRTSHHVADFLDFNPIDNLWHVLKEYIRREVKPKTKAELIDGIKEFCATVTVEKCTRYIRHLRKVIPRAIELGGDATGY